MADQGAITRVIAELESVGARLAPDDGVASFNQMYLLTTQQVLAATVGQSFADAEFVERLDEAFARLYLEAVAEPDDAPRAWRALFERRGDPGLHPLQFAIAGMNAHINFDLARALVQTSADLARDLPTDGRVRQDFLAVNDVLQRTQPLVKQHLLDGLAAAADRALGDADDVAGIWAISNAREFAWTSAMGLWAVRGTFLYDSMERSMDRIVSMTSTLLLRPVR